MSDEVLPLISVGIDIGTTTTQLVFSRLTLKSSGGYGITPKTEVSDKEILRRSRIYFTPLTANDEIDAPKVREIIEREYRAAGFTPQMIDTGAVIVTGESLRKSNSRVVCEEMAQIAGDFVVTSAGPDLESILAGKGAGCMDISQKAEYLGKICCNIDIGGGTSNIACFCGGETVSTGCLDIGGRLVRVDDRGKISYLSPKLETLAARHGITLKVGDTANADTMQRICQIMCDVLLSAVGLAPPSIDVEYMTTNHLIDVTPDLFTFSGGVADCIGRDYADFEFGDIGVIFGRTLRNSLFFSQGRTVMAAETMRATVIGAGSHSIELSGSTIEYRNCHFPLKSIPVLRQNLSCGGDIAGFSQRLRQSAENRGFEDGRPFAIAFKGVGNPTFAEIERLAGEIAASGIIADPLIVVVETDMAKALGQALKRRLPPGRGIICIDGVSCRDGDFIDMGEPISGGKVIPAVVKSLIFK